MGAKYKTIVTIGPSSNNPEILRGFAERRVDFFRINLSHTDKKDIEKIILDINRYGVTIILDTEGPQVRTGNLKDLHFSKGEKIKIYSSEIECDNNQFYLTPVQVIKKLRRGDGISLAFGSAHLVVEDNSKMETEGYVVCNVEHGGEVGSRKAVHLESISFEMPDFSEKDLYAFELAKKMGINHFTLSFMESPDSINKIKELYPKSFLISKIESLKGVNNFEEIVKVSDAILIDRGDLSSQVTVQKVPFIQKHLIRRCVKLGKEVFIATDTLQNMFQFLRPNVADTNDMINTLIDGASGIALTKETAVGKYPLQTVDMLKKIMDQVFYLENLMESSNSDFVKKILDNNNL